MSAMAFCGIALPLPFFYEAKAKTALTTFGACQFRLTIQVNRSGKQLPITHQGLKKLKRKGLEAQLFVYLHCSLDAHPDSYRDFVYLSTVIAIGASFFISFNLYVICSSTFRNEALL